MKLLHKLLIIVFCAVLIPISSSAIFLFYYRTQTVKSIVNLQQHIVQLAALMTEREMQDISRRFERLEFYKNTNEDNSYALLEKNKEFVFFSLLNKDGSIIFSGGDPEFVRVFGNTNAEEDFLFKQAVKSNIPAVGDFETVFNLPVCRIVYPLSSGKYALALVNMQDLAEKLEQQKFSSTGGLLLADETGSSIIFASNLEHFSQAAIKRMASSGGVFSFLSETGSRYLAVNSKVRNTSLYIIGIQNEDEALAGLNRISWLIAFMILAIATAIYIAAMLFAKRLSLPLNSLVLAANRVSQADFSKPVEVRSSFKELADVINSFNSMMKELESYKSMQLEKIFEEKQKLELLISLINDAILFCTRSGEIIYANKPANEILLDGEYEINEEDKRKKITGFLSRGIGNSSYEFNTEKTKKWYALNTRAVSAKNSERSVFITMHDITLERNLRQMKEDFFNSAAHDLRAPLLSLQGYVKLLEYDVKEEKHKEYVKNLDIASKRLFSLVENILEFSRLDSGGFNLDIQEFEIKTFFEYAVESFQPVFAQKNIEFKFENKMPKNAKIKADQEMLRRVVDNLLSNAGKFTPTNGKILFTAEPYKNKRVLFSVEDSGAGVPKDKIEKIFDRYSQLDDRSKKGFGLGLAICRKIVELHNGKIWAEAGECGVFRFFI